MTGSEGAWAYGLDRVGRAPSISLTAHVIWGKDSRLAELLLPSPRAAVVSVSAGHLAAAQQALHSEAATCLHAAAPCMCSEHDSAGAHENACHLRRLFFP